MAEWVLVMRCRNTTDVGEPGLRRPMSDHAGEAKLEAVMTSYKYVGVYRLIYQQEKSHSQSNQYKHAQTPIFRNDSMSGMQKVHQTGESHPTPRRHLNNHPGYKINNRLDITFACLRNLMHRALTFPSKPLRNAPLMEFTQALQTDERLAHLVVFHANRALLRPTILA